MEETLESVVKQFLAEYNAVGFGMIESGGGCGDESCCPSHYYLEENPRLKNLMLKMEELVHAHNHRTGGR